MEKFMTFEGALKRAKELMSVNVMVTMTRTKMNWIVVYKFD